MEEGSIFFLLGIPFTGRSAAAFDWLSSTIKLKLPTWCSEHRLAPCLLFSSNHSGGTTI